MKAKLILALFLITTSIGSLKASSESCDVYFVETTMTWHDKIGVRHQGLCFEDEHGAIECHFMPGGLQVCGKDCHFDTIDEEGSYLRRERIKEGHRSSKERSRDWCRRWAKGRQYCMTGYDCWTMVRDFCEAHRIHCNKTENTNTIRDMTGISGTVRGLEDGRAAFSRGDVIGGTLHVATAPLRGTVEALGSAEKAVGKGWCSLRKKWKF